MKATCCLLRYNPEFIPAIAILICSVSICGYEMPENPTNTCIWCCFSSPNRKVHRWLMMWIFLWGPFYLFPFVLCFHTFFLLSRPHLFFGSGSMHGVGEVMRFTTLRSCLEVINVPWSGFLEIENLLHLDRYCGAFWTWSGKKLGSITCWVPASSHPHQVMLSWSMDNNECIDHNDSRD